MTAPEPEPPSPIRMQIHPNDDFRVDGVLRLIDEARKPGPLGAVLKTMCEQVQVIAHADVVTVYVREQVAGEDTLVMRANVGFPASAVGTVRLRMGEGITGTAAEVMRPISASVAAEDSHYKHIPGLGEERYPSLLAIPLIVRGATAGVLVLQRSEANAFTSAEVALSTAIATTFAHALETARDEARELTPRSARLVGLPRARGVALGRAVMLGTLEAIRERASHVKDPAAVASRAFEDIAAIVRRSLRTLGDKLPEAQLRQLRMYAFMLDDQRLRDTIARHCGDLGIVPGLKQVAREYAAASFATAAADPLLEERATEIESLCLLVATSACGMPLPGAGAVLVVAERVTAMVALVAGELKAAAIACAGAIDPESLGVAVAAAAAVPVLCDVSGLFAWVRPDDSVLVDADSGVLRVNPPATQIARYRHGKP